jgi:hypothetical protein
LEEPESRPGKAINERGGTTVNKIALFAFNGELMCFVHILLNALDMNERGHEVKIIIEGSATRLIPELVKPDNPMSGLFKKARDRNLIEGACKACSNKMGTLEAVQSEGLKLL